MSEQKEQIIKQILIDWHVVRQVEVESKLKFDALSHLIFAAPFTSIPRTNLNFYFTSAIVFIYFDFFSRPSFCWCSGTVLFIVHMKKEKQAERRMQEES